MSEELTIPDEGVYTVKLQRKEMRGMNQPKDAPEVARIVRAVMKYADMSRYEGQLLTGLRHGRGRLIFGAPTWDEYEGEWRYDKKHGHGVYKRGPHARTGVYDGEWVDDMPHGRGLETFATGVTYEGEYELGVMHGIGCMTWKLPNNDPPEEHVYRGQFENGQRHGWGCLYLGVEVAREGGAEVRVSTNVYCGHWENGKRHGPGKMVYWHRTDGKPAPTTVDYEFNSDESTGGSGKSEVRIPDGSPIFDLQNMKLPDSQLAAIVQAVFASG